MKNAALTAKGPAGFCRSMMLFAAVLTGCQDSTQQPNEPTPQQTDASEDQTEVLPQVKTGDDVSPEADKSESFTHVLSGATEYYKGGPQQAQPPDGTFASGTKVELIEQAGSYSLVRSEDGTEAYVSAGSLRQIREPDSK